MRVRSIGLGKTEMVCIISSVKPLDGHLMMTLEAIEPVRWHIRTVMTYKDILKLIRIGTFSILLYLGLLEQLCPSVSISAVGVNFPKDFAGYTSVNINGRITHHIEGSWHYPQKTRQLIIAGRKGFIIFDDSKNAREKLLVREEHSSRYIECVPLEPLKESCRDFIKSIQENRQPKASIDFALGVAAYLEQAEKAMEP